MGYVFALLGALLFGANGSVAKLLVEGGLTATQLTLFRSLGTAVLAGLVLLVTDRAAFRLTRRQLLVMAVLGIGGVAMVQVTYAAALAYLPVGVTLLLQYLGVLIVALFAFLVFKEKVRARLWVAIGLVLIGLLAVARPWEAHLDPTGVALALIAALSLAFYFLVGERQVGRTSPLAVSFWTMVFASLLWGVFSGWWELAPDTFTKPLDVGGQWGSWEVPLGIPLLLAVVVGSFLAFLLFFSALKHLTATAAGVAASAEVVFAFAVAWVWLGETLDPVGVAGAAVVLAGIVVAQTARTSKTVVDAELVLPVGGRT